MPAQTDGMRDVVELFAANFFEALSFGCELFVDLDYFFRHLLVRFLFAAQKREIRPGGEPFVPVAVEADTEHDGFALFLPLLCWFRHVERYATDFPESKLICARRRKNSI